MEILCISDTHLTHNELELIRCDVLIVSGDICVHGTIEQVELFADWIASQSDKFQHLIFVPGNHDHPFVHYKEASITLLRSRLGAKLHYLEDSECVIDEVKFYGSPWQPEHGQGAFSLPRSGKKLKAKWAKIPEDVDVLITHCAPFGVGDRVFNNHVGCIELLKKLNKLKNLGLHVFGHVHSGNGAYICDEFLGTQFCNAAVCDNTYQPTNPSYLYTYIPDCLYRFSKPITIDLRKKNG